MTGREPRLIVSLPGRDTTNRCREVGLGGALFLIGIVVLIFARRLSDLATPRIRERNLRASFSCRGSSGSIAPPSAERESVDGRTGVEELDLEETIGDRPLLPDQLIHPWLNQHA